MKYKLVVFVPLLVLMGCSHKHKCVVNNVTQNEIHARDLESGTDKVFVYHDRCDHLEFIYPGDTFECVSNNARTYEQSTVIDIPRMGYLMTNIDSLNARQDRKWHENLRRAGYRYWNRAVR